MIGKLFPLAGFPDVLKGVLKALTPWNTFYGKDGVHWTPYMTRVYLTPMTPWGQLVWHVFHRGDADPDPHDHPFDFVTFPLTSYLEVHRGEDGLDRYRRVLRWRLHRRQAEYRHRVVGRLRWRYDDADPYKPGYFLERCAGRIHTLIWRQRDRRQWGFWCLWDGDASYPEPGLFVPWRDYIYGERRDSGDAEAHAGHGGADVRAEPSPGPVAPDDVPR